MSEAELCQFCGEGPAEMQCSVSSCSRKRLCESCDEIWHGHPARRDHRRFSIRESSQNYHVDSNQTERNPKLLMEEQSSDQTIPANDIKEPAKKPESIDSMKSQSAIALDNNKPASDASDSHRGQVTGLSWTCNYCTIENEFCCDAEALKIGRFTCIMCSKTVPVAEVVEFINAQQDGKVCVTCTLVNRQNATHCDGCENELKLPEICKKFASDNNNIVDVPSATNGQSDAASQMGAHSSSDVATRASKDFQTAHKSDFSGGDVASGGTFNVATNHGYEQPAYPKREFQSDSGAKSSEQLDSERRNAMDPEIDRLLKEGYSYEQALQFIRDRGLRLNQSSVDSASKRSEHVTSTLAVALPAACSSNGMAFVCSRCGQNKQESDPFEYKCCKCKLCFDCFCERVVQRIRNGRPLWETQCCCSRFPLSNDIQALKEHYESMQLQIRQKIGDGSQGVLDLFESALLNWRVTVGTVLPSAPVPDLWFECRQCRCQLDYKNRIIIKSCSCQICIHCFDIHVVDKLLNRCKVGEFKCPNCAHEFLSSTAKLSDEAKWIRGQVLRSPTISGSDYWRSDALNHLDCLFREMASKCALSFCLQCYTRRYFSDGKNIFYCVDCKAYICNRCGRQAQSSDRCQQCDVPKQVEQSTTRQNCRLCGHLMDLPSSPYLDPYCEHCKKFACYRCLQPIDSYHMCSRVSTSRKAYW